MIICLFASLLIPFCSFPICAPPRSGRVGAVAPVAPSRRPRLIGAGHVGEGPAEVGHMERPGAARRAAGVAIPLVGSEAKPLAPPMMGPFWM